MRLSAGIYDQPVTLWRQSVQRGAAGSIDRSEPEEVCRRWANAIPEASVRFQQLNAIWERMKAAYTLHGPTPAEVGQWLSHRDRWFEVVGIETPGGVPPSEAEQVTVICEGRDG